MNNNAWFKKENPLLSLHSMGGGAAGTLMQGAAAKTYADDVFSTYLYEETGSTVTVNNSVDMSEGGMVWFKNREATDSHVLVDTERGGTKVIHSDTNAAESTQSGAITSFNDNGFAVGNYGAINGGSNKDVASWTFRKAPGFFDVVKYTPSGGTNTISHNLGCVPGMIIVKNLDNSENWAVFHRGIDATSPNDYGMKLNTTDARFYGGGWNVTATTFDASFSLNNSDGHEHIAYLFAGGASTAATARSVDFDGSGDYLSSETSSDLSFGTGDYTVEFWFNADTISDSPLFENRVSGSASDTTGFTLTAHGSTNGVRIWWSGSSRINGGGSKLHTGQWYHLAATRSSGTTYLFLNGELLGTTTDSIDLTTTEAHIGGGKYSGGTAISHYYDGKISNVRIIKGTALYTSSFRVPYEPLTNVTNTKLLCCNNSSTTGSTVAPGTITANGDPTASTDIPFDDPEGFKFGEGENENMVKCGSYKGTGSAGLDVNVGWEPSFLLWKESSGSGENWFIHDNLRGWDNKYLKPNANSSETDSGVIKITSTGFTVESTDGARNHSGETYIYMVIRRPDGYVGKPAEAGTDVFAMATGTSSADPQFVSGFITDFMLRRAYATSTDWLAGSRLIGTNYLITNSNTSESATSGSVWDYMNGMGDWSSDTTSQLGWNWKRHAGFDVLKYTGNGIARAIPHSLNKTPEMMWFKNRDSSREWAVYHKGLNGGTTPQNYHLHLEQSTAEVARLSQFNNTAPTSTHFTVGTDGDTNENGEDIIAMLFASVEGISKCGSYSPSSTSTTVTCGFQPRFVVVKAATKDNGWAVADSVRGINAGNDPCLFLNEDWEPDKYGSADWIDVSATGFTVNSAGGAGTADANSNGETYIYYAHA